MHYLSYLGIKDPIHKQKISLKAMDVVLFGPPKGNYPHMVTLKCNKCIIILHLLHNVFIFLSIIKYYSQ